MSAAAIQSPVDTIIIPNIQQLEKKQEELLGLLSAYESKREKLNMQISEKRGAIGVLRYLTQTQTQTQMQTSFTGSNLLQPQQTQPQQIQPQQIQPQVQAPAKNPFAPSSSKSFYTSFNDATSPN